MKQGWEYKKLGDCTQILDSQRKPVTKKDRTGGIYPYYGATGIQDYVDKYIFDGRYVLVGEDGAKWSAFEQSAFIIEGKSWVNNHAHVLKPHDFLVDTFLIYFLNYSDLDSYISGAIVRKLTQASLRNIEIPLPPKSTQLAIVSELDKINELIRLKKEQLKDFDNLAQSIFYEMFGDPVENEMGWEVKKLGDSIKVIGGYAFCSKNFLKSGIPVLRIGNINTGKFTPTNMVYWQKDKGLSRYRILPGDLVISLTGTVGKSDYGNVCILGNDYEEYYLNQRNAKLEVGSNLNKYFLTYLLKQDMIRKKLTGINRGVRQANIANRDIENLNIPLPPLPLQHLFAQRIEQIEHQKAEVQKAIADLETLLASRMQYWFE